MHSCRGQVGEYTETPTSNLQLVQAILHLDEKGDEVATESNPRCQSNGNGDVVGI